MKFLYKLNPKKDLVKIMSIDTATIMNKEELARFIDDLYHIQVEMVMSDTSYITNTDKGEEL